MGIPAHPPAARPSRVHPPDFPLFSGLSVRTLRARAGSSQYRTSPIPAKSQNTTCCTASTGQIGPFIPKWTSKRLGTQVAEEASGRSAGWLGPARRGGCCGAHRDDRLRRGGASRRGPPTPIREPKEIRMSAGLTLNKITSQRGVSIGEAARRIADLGWNPSYVQEAMTFPTDYKIGRQPKDPMKQVLRSYFPMQEEKDIHDIPGLPGNNNFKVFYNGATKMGYGATTGRMAINSQPRADRGSCQQYGFCFQGCKSGAKWSTLYTEIPAAEKTGRLELRTECHVAKIEHDAAGKVTGVVYFDKDGKGQRQKARVVCVAGNAIETPRLLLMSASSKFPDGLANSSGLAGRNYMRHTTGSVYATFEQEVHMYRGTSMAGMWIVGEDLPQESNRVTPHPTEKDQWGLPVPNVHYDDHPNDIALRNHAYKQATALYESVGAKKVYQAPPYPSTHNLGTCRMSAKARDGVVNKWGQTHDIPNLFISDGSQYTTGATENPTLTIVTLAIRQAEYIANQMQAKAL